MFFWPSCLAYFPHRIYRFHLVTGTTIQFVLIKKFLLILVSGERVKHVFQPAVVASILCRRHLKNLSLKLPDRFKYRQAVVNVCIVTSTYSWCACVPPADADAATTATSKPPSKVF